MTPGTPRFPAMGNRRQALAAFGALVASLPAFAQQGKVHRIAFLSSESRDQPAQVQRLVTLREALRSLGYAEGRNVVIDAWWADGDYGRLPRLAGQIVAAKPDVVVASGSKAAVAMQHATTTIPIILGSSSDAVGIGATTNLARPSGNVTGWSFFGTDLVSKIVDLLKQAAPRVTRVAYLANPASPSLGPVRSAVPAVKAVGIELETVEARSPSALSDAFNEIARRRFDGVVVQADTMFASNAQAVARHALSHRLPSASSMYEFAEAGGLLAYGPDRLEGYRRAAVYIDRIAKGAKVADLPIEQASKFDLTINTATAKALGLAIPPALAATARLI